MKTKAKRQELRKSWINGKETEIYKDIEILINDDVERERYICQIWKGTAGKPYINYYYTSQDKRQFRINQEKRNADRREINKKSYKKTVTTAAQTSKTIKKLLLKDYPNIKWSVTSENFSGGNAVRIKWNDGPSYQEIDSFAKQFQYGTFNGMIDLYEYTNKEDYPQVKFVTISRNISEGIYNKAFHFAKNYYSDFENVHTINDWLNNYRCTAKNFLWKKLNKINLSKGFNEQEFKKNINSY